MSSDKLHDLFLLPELDLFKLPSITNQVEKSTRITYRPLAALSNESPIEFYITGSEDELISLNKTRLYLKFNVQYKPVGTENPKISDWKNLELCQNALNGIFKDVEITIGDKQVSSSCSTYSYISFFHTLLNKSYCEKSTSGRAAHWFENSASITDNISTFRSEVIRPVFTDANSKGDTEGQILEMIGSLDFDLATQPRPLPGAIPIRIKLYQHKSDFIFYTTDSDNFKPQLVLKDAYLSVHKYKLTHIMQSALKNALRSSPLKYPITRREVKYFTVHSTSPSGIIDNAIVGQIPRRCFSVFIDNKNFEGSLSSSPYAFKHFNLIKMSCSVNGEQYPSRPYEFDFNSYLCMTPFQSIHDVLGIPNNFNYDYDTYKDNFPLIAFDLSPDNAPGKAKYINMPKYGTMRIEFQFKSALTSTATLLLFCEYDNIIQIDNTGTVTTDYN